MSRKSGSQIVQDMFIDSDGKEFKVCLKLTEQHINAKGQTRQRVRLAAQLLSHTVGKGVRQILGETFACQSDAILTVNAWFDTMNSRVKFNSIPERCGFGIKLDQQQKALNDMENLIHKMDFCSFKKRKRGRLSIPFQRGILVSIKSTRALWREIQPTGNYLLTCKLNSDPVENYFSNIRGMSGDQTHPGPATYVYRAKILLLKKNPTDVVRLPAVEHIQEPSVTGVAVQEQQVADDHLPTEQFVTFDMASGLPQPDAIPQDEIDEDLRDLEDKQV